MQSVCFAIHDLQSKSIHKIADFDSRKFRLQFICKNGVDASKTRRARTDRGRVHRFPFACRSYGEGLQICAECGSFADATLLVVNEQGEYRRGAKMRPLRSP